MLTSASLRQLVSFYTLVLSRCTFYISPAFELGPDSLPHLAFFSLLGSSTTLCTERSRRPDLGESLSHSLPCLLVRSA